MSKKLAAILIVILFSLSINTTSGQITVGVKEGDWIEYNSTTTGTPPEEHNVTWARMDILRVQGNEIDVNVTTQARNGTVASLLMTLNPEKGQIGAWWIIPINLSPGDMFYDAFFDRNITIEGQEEKTFADATRTVINATTSERVKLWDRTTGVFLVSKDTLPDYSIEVVAYRTNLWSAQTPTADQTVTYALIIIVVTAIIAAVLVTVTRNRRKRQ